MWITASTSHALVDASLKSRREPVAHPHPTNLRNDLHATQLPKCTHASVRAPQHTRRTKASSSPQSEELRAASMLYSTLRNYRKLGPGNKEKIVQKLCQAVSCVRTNGIAARGSLPSPTLTPDPNPNRVLMS